MTHPLAELAVVLRKHKTTLFAEWQSVVTALPGAAHLDGPTLRDHIPQFIDEMIVAIAHCDESTGMKLNPGSPQEHGIQRLAAGFGIKEVVIEYNILRDAVHDLAESAGINLGAAEFRVINHIIDAAVALAVDTYAQEQAAELQRRRDEHFAFIAHDVRTPLNAITLTAALLAEKPDPDEAAEMLRVLLRNVQRIEELISRVMDEEKHPRDADELHLVRRNFDLWPLVHRLLQDLQPVTEAAGIKIHNSVPHDLVIHADAGLLTRALQNLVSNSARFAPGGDIEVGAAATEGKVECWVRDNGAGIEPERLEKIFEKSETDPDPERAGTGLGLAIFKQIIEAHGGQISVESCIGAGATFRFMLPAADPS